MEFWIGVHGRPRKEEARGKIVEWGALTREVRIGDERKPTLRHRLEAEEGGDWQAKKDFVEEVVIVGYYLSGR